MVIAETCHKWPRGLKKRLIELDGDQCFFCWSHQRPFHIAHIDDYEMNKLHSFPYSDENKYDPRYLLLLCNSCHSKLDSMWFRGSPWYLAFMAAYRERNKRLFPEQEKVKHVQAEGEAMSDDCFGKRPDGYNDKCEACSRLEECSLITIRTALSGDGKPKVRVIPP